MASDWAAPRLSVPRCPQCCNRKTLRIECALKQQSYNHLESCMPLKVLV